MSEFIKTNIQDRVMTITLDRLDKKNALTIDMYAAITAAMRAAEADTDVRILLFQGDTTCFTSGNDLADFMQRPPTGADAPVFQFLTLLPVFSKPIIAAVAGAAVGVGTTMLLHCDLIYAADNAKFKLPFVNLGVVPEAGSTKLLPEMLGHARASELLLFGDTFGAEKALELGLINSVHAADELLEYARQQAVRLAQQPPSAIRQTKALLKKRHGNTLIETVLDEGAQFIERLLGPEAQEALAAFMERRQPEFSQFE